MDDTQGATPPDDTAAFQRFYSGSTDQAQSRSLLYRILIGWWRDRP
jgi:hypothetical protein